MSTIKVDTIATRTGSGNITVSNNASLSGDLTVDTNTLKVDATNNRVFVGATSGDRKFEVHDTGVVVANFKSTGANSLMAFDNSSDTSQNHLIGFSGDDFRVVETTEKIRVLSSGGITFNGDTAAANALNDYEEGTWTPTLVSSGATFAYSVQLGIYTKIGDLVTFNCVIQLDGGGNSFTGNNVSLNGWPFATRNSTGAHGRFFIYGRYLNLDAGNGYTYAFADLAGNSSSAPLKEGGDNTPINFLASNDLSSSSGQLYLHGHYYTDS